MRHLKLVLPATLLLSACGGPSVPEAPASKTPASLEGTAVGKNRCAGPGAARPFVVEWDATDLASFEAKAGRDVVFVRFEGCELEPVYDCADDGMAGRFGRYQQPQWTSGSVDAFAIEDETELYAKLPLGAVSLAGRVQRGQKLRLEYFVSGLVTATRGTVTKSEVKAISGCRRATHFVAGYNLGSFELVDAASSKDSGSAEAFGAGAGVSQASRRESLRRGGSLASCATQSQLECRVPIRLDLRALSDEAPEDDARVAERPEEDAPPPLPEERTMTPERQAAALRESAKNKHKLKDGAGCLVDLDRADKIDPQGAKKVLYERAICMMMSGRCDDGRKLYTEVVKAGDQDRTKSDKAVEDEVQRYVDAICPVRDRSPQARLEGAIRAINEEIYSKKTSNADVCVAAAKEIESVLPNFPKPREKFGPGRADGVSSWLNTAKCLAAAGRCGEAKTWFMKAREMEPENTRPWSERKADAEASFPTYVPGCSK